MNKIISILIASFLAFGINQAEAQCCQNKQQQSSDKTAIIERNNNLTDSLSFKVSGNCGMCKARIEKAALSVNGVEKAQWDAETGILKIALSKEISIHEIHKAVAKAGHDTEMHNADDAVYNKLPACCKYDR